MSAKFTRKLLLDYTSIKLFAEFPQNTTSPHGKVFKNVVQGTCIVLFKKEKPSPKHQFDISINNDIYSVPFMRFEKIQQDSIKSFYPYYYEIPLLVPGAASIISKMKASKLKVRDFLRGTAQGNINTIHLGRIRSDTPTGAIIAKGANIHRWAIDGDLFSCVISDETKSIFNENKNKFMIISQNITSAIGRYRIKATPFECRNTRIVFLDSTNILYLRSPEEMRFICAVLNASCTDWIFRLTSTNNHVNMYELVDIPVPDATTEQQNEIAYLVQQIETAKKNMQCIDELEKEVDIKICQLYGLTKKEISIVRREIKL